MQALYEQLCWRFTAWINSCLQKYLTALDCEHDLVCHFHLVPKKTCSVDPTQVRAYVSEALEFVSKIKVKNYNLLIFGFPL